jgi:hypothetical protein
VKEDDAIEAGVTAETDAVADLPEEAELEEARDDSQELSDEDQDE